MTRYREYAEYQLPMDGEGAGLRQARAALHPALSQAKEVRELDEIVIEAIQVNDYIDQALLEDDASRPLDHWWWHLGALRAGTYPAAELPEALRVVYLERAGKR